MQRAYKIKFYPMQPYFTNKGRLDIQAQNLYSEACLQPRVDLTIACRGPAEKSLPARMG